jgi:copper homeostasis protein
MTFRNQQIAGMGSEEGAEFKLRVVDPERVKNMRSIAESASTKNAF